MSSPFDNYVRLPADEDHRRTRLRPYDKNGIIGYGILGQDNCGLE